MIRLVFLLDPLTVLGVALSEPAVVVVSLDLLDVRPALPLEYAPDVLLEKPAVLESLMGWRAVPVVRTHGKEREGLDVRLLGERGGL